MRLPAYLPSTHFLSIAGSIAAAAGLIVGSQYLTTPHAPATVATNDAAVAAQAQEDWRAQLDQIQADSPGLPPAPDENAVANLLNAAKSNNLTDTVARSLFVNLSDASAQGMGSDIPTQESIIASVSQNVGVAGTPKTYTQSDVTLVEDSTQTRHDYGNAVMVALGNHQDATSRNVLLAMSNATDSDSPAQLQALAHVQHEYQALVADLTKLRVPKTLAPLHVQALNDLAAAANSVGDMQKLFEDPLRGLQALQQYQLLLGEVARVFTSIAEQFGKNGILFTNSEPGAAWTVFVSTPIQ